MCGLCVDCIQIHQMEIIPKDLMAVVVTREGKRWLRDRNKIVLFTELFFYLLNFVPRACITYPQNNNFVKPLLFSTSWSCPKGRTLTFQIKVLPRLVPLSQLPVPIVTVSPLSALPAPILMDTTRIPGRTGVPHSGGL